MSNGYSESEGYAASLRQMADIVSVWDGADPDELQAAAAFIERQQAEINRLLELFK